MAMGASLIVACLAVAGLQAVRVQRRINEQIGQTANARKLAQAGIEFAQHRIETDPNWRSFFVHGVAINRTVNGGSFSVTLTDPVDGILSNRTTDPVVVTSNAIVGQASQKWSARMEPQNQLYAACRSAMHAPVRIDFTDCNVTSDQWAYCDDQIQCSPAAVVNMSCMAGLNAGVTTSYARRFVQGGKWPMEGPDLDPASSSYVGKYYIDNAVVINASDLPTGGTELIKNGGFEIDTSTWTGSSCTLTRDTSQRHSGVASCFVSDQGFLSAPVQNVAEHMLKGRQYNVSFWIRTTEDQNINAGISFISTGSFVPLVQSGPYVAAKKDTWTQVSATITASWLGNLTKAEVFVGSERNSNYHFDSVSLIDAERQPGIRYLEQVVIGGGNNPYGAKTVSANGIYSINALGEVILIRNCRINGTLIVQSATDVQLENAISWEPIGRNFPTLIADAPIEDLTSVAELSESTIGVNLNIAGSPYQGVTDTDTSDSYSSVISGPMVSTSDVILGGISVLRGPVIAGNEIDVRSTALTINFQSDMILNPPPGFFADPPRMRLLPSSLQSEE